VVAEQVGVVHRVGGGQHVPQLAQPEACLLAHQDHGDAPHVGLAETALPARNANWSQQAHALPVTQDVSGQAEAASQFTDGEVRRRRA
jgi:hypothetical protein